MIGQIKIMSLIFDIILSGTLTSLTFGLLIFVLFTIVRFYWNVQNYPPGPFPLPLIGNLYQFGSIDPYKKAIEWSKIYGPVFTIWLGHQPMVILATHDAIVEAYRDNKHDFLGRPTLQFAKLFSAAPGSTDIMLSDYGREWEVLRRVTHTAVRKFQVSPELPKLEVAIIDEVVDLMVTTEGLDKPFDPSKYVYLMIHSIIATTCAGQSYKINSQDFLDLKAGSEMQRQLDSKLTLIEFLPILKFWYWKEWQQLGQAYKVLLNWCDKQLDAHLDTYKDGIVRDFCDALIGSRNEAQKSDPEAAKYLHRDNLINSLQDLFQAGSETTRMTFMWMILTMVTFPQIQAKLRSEIDSVIGQEIPNNDHRLKCHFVSAFIFEVLRFRPNVPLGFPHKTLNDTHVQGIPIPKNTTVTSLMYSQLHDVQIWKDPQNFRPERFLNPQSGQFDVKINSANLPFSIGRRACLGDKLATINLFIELSRLLQKTKGFKFELPSSSKVTLEHDSQQSGSRMVPLPFQIVISRDT